MTRISQISQASYDHGRLTYAEALKRHRTVFSGGRPLKVVVGGNCNASFLVPGLTVALRQRDYDPTILPIEMDGHVAWSLEGGQADVVVFWMSSFAASVGETRLGDIDIDGLVAATKALIERGTRVFIITFEFLTSDADQWSPVATWRRSVGEALTSSLPSEAVRLDAQIVQVKLGMSLWSAPRYWASARCPCHPDAATSLAVLAGQSIAQSLKICIKAVAVDLDNTLWGGVVGDDGPENLALDAFGEGRPFIALQRYLLGLKERGIPIAAISKNEPAAVEAVWRQRSEMVLKPEDFFGIYASWRPKHEKLKEFAETLNIGTDALCFIDDSPYERAEALAALHDLVIPELPEQPDERLPYLMNLGLFFMPVFGKDDVERAQRYSSDKLRRQEIANAVSIEEYLESLNMTLKVFPVGAANLSRSASLIQKTNQFNMTGRRHLGPAVLQFASDPEAYAMAYEVQDRFGESGIVAVVLAKAVGDALEIDTWVMSCRVFGRGVEDAIYEHLRNWGAGRGCRKVKVLYVDNGRNALVREFLLARGGRESEHVGEAVVYDLPIGLERRHYLHILDDIDHPRN